MSIHAVPRGLNAALLMLLAAALAVACGTSADVTATPTATPEISGATPTEGPTNQATPTPTSMPEGRDMEAYFRGKTIINITGTAPGGTYDYLARAYALDLPKYIPGKPRMVVQNLPGSGQLRGVQAIMRAEPNGLTFGSQPSRWLVNELLGNDVEGYDIDSPRFLGSPQTGARPQIACISTRIGRSWDDVLALGRPITFGALAPGAINTLGLEFLQLVGAPVRVVHGYGGISEFLAAFDRNELDGTVSCSAEGASRLFPEWFTDDRAVPLLYWGDGIEAEIELMGLPPEAAPPHILDLPGVEMTEEQRLVFDSALEIQRQGTQLYFLPPETPDDIWQVFREAMEQVEHDEEWRARMTAGGFGDSIKLGDPDDLRQIFAQIRGLSPDALQVFRTLVAID